MRHTVKIIILLLCFFAITYSHAGAQQNETDQLLYGLGIINEDNEAADGAVTRAEFIAFAVRLTGVKAVYSYDHPVFTDVAKTYWAYDDICAAYAMGLIYPDGNGRLNPDSPIDAASAARILLNAVGYGDYIRSKSDAAVLTVASEKKIFDKVFVSDDRPLKRAEIYRMLYNTLNVELFIRSSSGYSVAEGKTLLTERFDTEYIEGIVTADEQSAIYGERMPAGYIKINNEMLDMSGIKTEDSLLALNVSCYFRDTGVGCKVLCIYEENNRYSEFTLRSAGYSDGIFSQDVNGNTKKYKTDKKTTVMINGDIISDPALINTTMEKYDGSIKMIDNDSDGVYNVVIIKRFINAVVESYNDSDNVLKTKGGVTYKLDDYGYVCLTNYYGERISPVSFEIDTVISVFAPVTGDALIIATGPSLEASVTEKRSGDDAYILCDDGSRYILSKTCLVTLSEINVGEVYTLYTDCAGEIAYVKRTSDKSELAYLINAALSDEGDQALLKLFTDSGSILTLGAADNIILRNASGASVRCKDPETLIEGLQEDGSQKGVPVMYRCNSAGKVIKLCLATEDSSKEFHILTDDKVTISNGRYEYRPYNFSGKYVCTSDTLFMAVPMQRGNDDDYRILSSSLFKSGSTYRFSTTYYKRNSAINISVEPNGFLTDFFVYKVDKNETTLIKSDPVLVKKIGEALNEDGNVTAAVTVVSSGGTEKSYNIENCENGFTDCTGRKVSPGDIIRIDNDEYGSTSKMLVDTMYDSVNNIHLRYLGDSTNRILAANRVIPAMVIGRQGDYIQIDTCSGVDPNTSEMQSREIVGISSALVYVYNKNKKILEVSDISRVTAGDSFVMYTAYGTAKMIVYYE